MIGKIILASSLMATTVFISNFVFTGEASAQFRLPELTETEMDTIRNIVRVEMTDKEPGTVIQWENSQTGNLGAVILRGVSVTEDMECREVTLVLRMSGESDRRGYTWNSCRLSDGTWTIMF